jgi:hypothetical protein
MKESFWQIIIFFSFSVSYGQDPFVPKYKFSDEILLQLSKDTLNYKAAWDLSFIGEYQKALEIWDRDEQKWPSPLQAQVDEFKRYKPVNANKLIAEKAKTEQIIILNEAHQQPYHRVFTTSLLQDLYNQGYRYFGAETIWDWDSLLNKRKYPTLKTGYYTQEPCYGNMVREAIRIGYKVFSYESTRQKSDSAGINLREIDQAKNIRKILDKDPKAKILIHCGFDHLVETPVYSWGKAMAGRLIEYTGIDPLITTLFFLIQQAGYLTALPGIKIMMPGFIIREQIGSTEDHIGCSKETESLITLKTLPCPFRVWFMHI